LFNEADADFQLIYDPEKTKQILVILYQDTVTYDHRKAKQMQRKSASIVVTAEHAVVVERIKTEPRKDSQLQTLSIRICNGDW